MGQLGDAGDRPAGSSRQSGLLRTGKGWQGMGLFGHCRDRPTGSCRPSGMLRTGEGWYVIPGGWIDVVAVSGVEQIVTLFENV